MLGFHMQAMKAPTSSSACVACSGPLTMHARTLPTGVPVSVDVIHSNHVVEHVLHPVAAMAQPGGCRGLADCL